MLSRTALLSSSDSSKGEQEEEKQETHVQADEAGDLVQVPSPGPETRPSC